MRAAAGEHQDQDQQNCPQQPADDLPHHRWTSFQTPPFEPNTIAGPVLPEGAEEKTGFPLAAWPLPPFPTSPARFFRLNPKAEVAPVC